jgi:CubicO group peptidase (beta-lactamase class C family)
MNTGHKEDTTWRVFQDHYSVTLFGLRARHKAATNGHAVRDRDDNWPRMFLSLAVEYQPGSWFVYNTGATYMLSAILTKLTGETLVDYLRPRLFDPLGIEHPTWETDPRGVSIGGTGLHAKTEDIARFGQMYLRQGAWAGKRAHSDNGNTQTNPDWTVG